MKILITGGAGFIGSNLCDYLLERMHEVVIVDDLSTGHKLNLTSSIGRIEFIEGKVEHFDFSLISGLDAVVHLAAQASVPLSITNFGDSSCSNLVGTIRIMDFCRLRRIPLIYASSSAIYGNLSLGDDEVKEIDLISPYAADKFAMELYARTAHELYQLSSIGLRFFNVYGPRQDPHSPYSGVISIFVDKVLSGQEITIYGGSQTRDFVYVQDVVSTLESAIYLASTSVICEVSNVLSGTSVSIDNLSNQIMNVTGEKVDTVYKPLPSGDPEQSDGTVAKMARLFGIKVDMLCKLSVGLNKTIRYIESQK